MDLFRISPLPFGFVGDTAVTCYNEMIDATITQRVENDGSFGDLAADDDLSPQDLMEMTRDNPSRRREATWDPIYAEARADEDDEDWTEGSE
jgi:hypothetical protein